MSFKHVLEAYDLLDDANVTGDKVRAWWQAYGVQDVTSTTIKGDKGTTDFVTGIIPGASGRSAGGDAPTLGIIGRLGGLGARPERIGFVSDGDGALTAVASAGKLAEMRQRGDVLPGDVIVSTHICPDAPTRPHEPVAFMDSPVDISAMNEHEVVDAMDAILSVDTTKGNRIVNHLGFAITPTIKQGWIMRVSEDLLQIYADSTGILPVTLPITMQDITPYGNGIYHVNSIVQPCVATSAPVVGIAITTQTPVPGSGTGATNLAVVESTVRYCIEVAKAFGSGQCSFFEPAEYDRLVFLYGDMTRLQGAGS